jgi:hypothetical protein
MWSRRLVSATVALTSMVFTGCDSSGAMKEHLAQVAVDFKSNEPISLLPYAKLRAPAMAQFSDGSLYFFSSGIAKDVTLELESPSRASPGVTRSMRAAAIEAVPSPENGTLVLHVFGRDECPSWASVDVTEVLLHPKVCVETRTELK